MAVGHWMLWQDSTRWEQRSAEWRRFFCQFPCWDLLPSSASFQAPVMLLGFCSGRQRKKVISRNLTAFKEKRSWRVTLEPSSAPAWDFHRNQGRSYRVTASAGGLGDTMAASLFAFYLGISSQRFRHLIALEIFYNVSLWRQQYSSTMFHGTVCAAANGTGGADGLLLIEQY